MATQAFGKRAGATKPIGHALELTKGRTSGLAVPVRDGEAAGGFSFKYFACFLFMLMLLAAFVYSTCGALYRDLAHGSSFLADASIKVERAECTRTNFIVTDCDIDLSWMAASGPKTQRAGFMVLFASLADTPVVPLRSSRDPEVVSTQAAVDRMTNRTVTFLVFASILLMLVVVAFKKTLTGAAPGQQE